jgi:hypothetical protein
MLAAYPDIQASNYMINQYDLLLPGIYDPGIVLLLKDKVNNDDFVVLGWSGLMLAVINQAKIDASKGDQEAIEWLKSDQCYDICYSLGFEHANILDWLKRGKLKQ